MSVCAPGGPGRQNGAMDGVAHPSMAAGLGPLGADEPDIETRCRLVRGAGVGAVTVWAAEPGMRPRSLSRSARRDVAARLRRAGVRCVGVELWVPRQHFDEPGRVDGAVEALVSCVSFATELAELTDGSAALHTSLPMSDGWLHPAASTVVDAALGDGVAVIDHGELGVSDAGENAGVRAGVDAAACVLRGEDPGDVVLANASRVASVRVGDAVGNARVRLGRGELDLTGLVIAWSPVASKPGLVIDLRGVDSPAERLGEAVDSVTGLLPPVLG